ncbi:MAG: ribosome maturation factor RimM [Pseudomonadota bacterium]|nr:ribosome maturation factor RimM [Pseudomonadota bacterium]
MGRVIGAYGVQGWIKARTYSASPNGLLAHRSWWLATTDEQWREFAVLEARVHADTLIAGLEGLARREDAALWRGASIGVPRGSLPALDQGEVYWADLVGLAVINRSGVTLGRVHGVLETGAHPILRVAAEGRGDDGERLIPLVPRYVDAIDVAAAQIVVDWQPDY